MAVPDMAVPDKEICALGVAELGHLYRTRALSPVEVARATLDRIQRLNPTLNAYITVLADSALAEARAAELQLAAGVDLGPLHGVPVSVKDLIRVKGTRTTAASKVLQDAPLDAEDATVTRRLRAAGAVLVGKVNLHEFAYGDPDPESPFGVVQNPRKVGYQSGSSSSGSASAVGAGLGVVSLGSDTGGSIRHPASVCGVVGLKATYGRVPVRGVVPLSVHLDHVGPLARSVADAAACLGAIAGHDPADPFSVDAPVEDYLGAVGRDVRGLRMGVPTNPWCRFGTPSALALLDRARAALAELGLSPIPLELPRIEESLDLGTTLIGVDLWVSHEQYRGREALYGRPFLKRALPFREVSGLRYAQAKDAQAEIRRLWLALFERIDLLVLPANSSGTAPHGVETIEVDGQPLDVRSATSRFNRISNLTGFPAISVPIGETPEGLPIGIQLVGPPFAESRLLAVGHALEQALGDLPAQWGIEPRR